MYKPNFFKKIVFMGDWIEVFVVLCDMGLMCFKELDDYRCYFIPTKGAVMRETDT